VALHDVRHPPVTVVGHNHAADATGTMAMYQGVDAPLVSTSIRAAEMVKYASNTWHALKICFANEIGNLCKQVGVDSHEVMDIFCQDQKLNLSSYYLKPGFAFGGSCLPKDLKALVYLAKSTDVEVPMLASIMPSNAAHIEHAVEQVLASGLRRVGMLGLSFKAGTDDLRESPLVIMAERFIGKGLQLSIYDPQVNVARLIGANRRFIEESIPHIASVMTSDVAELVREADVLVVASTTPEALAALQAHTRPDQLLLDVVGLPDREAHHAQYRGVCW
jgi:GDP-mannose 6-dehydrogenase